MKDPLKNKTKINYLLFVLAGVLIIRCSNNGEVYAPDLSEKKSVEASPVVIHEEIAVTPPPFSDGIFPCNDCHNFRKPDPVRRKLIEWHEDISGMFNHDRENRWCLDCHDLNNRDSLRLASGKLLDFKESYKLCGQCHGDKLRDWRAGVHGKRTGEWNGRKQYFLCVSCHNPHSPKFARLKPEPPPLRLDESNK
jgi:hypothetical protein